MSDPIVGIDLGTSNSVVAYAEATGSVRVLADEAGNKIHPSVVSFHPSGGVVVGAAAKQRKVIDPKNTIFSAKRLIGRGYDSPEVQTAKKRMPYEIKEGANHAPVIATRAGEYAIPEISAIVLDHMRNVAASALGEPVNRAVVTVPASFNDAQRSATATAGSIAGLSVVRVLNEPTAAALAYGHTRQLHEVIAVYDFGGGTFDITILKLADQVYEVLGTGGDTFLGGDDLDERLVDRMVEKFLLEQRIDLRTNEVSMMRLRAVAEQTKIELSRRSRAVVRIDEIAYGPSGKPLDLQIEITRDEFVHQIADIVDRTFPVCEEALRYAGLDLTGIADVILVGGTTKIPYVRDQVSRFFNKAPRTDVSPEDAVALGAGLQAVALERILKRKSPSRQPTDTEPHTHAADEDTLDGPTEDLNHLLGEQTEETPASKKRSTAGYSEVMRTAEPSRHGERPVERGHTIDRIDDRGPLPAAATPIGRITARAPTAQAMRTLPGTAVPGDVARADSKPVAAPPPVPSKVKTAQSVPVPVPRPPSPPAVPAAPPQAKTLVLDPEPPLEEIELAPSSTAKGFAPVQPQTYPVMAPVAVTPVVRPAASAAPTMIAPPAPLPAGPVVLDVTPRGLGIGTVAGFCEELIRRNSRVPTEIRKLFTTSRDKQDTVRIVVVQGESRRMEANLVIGDLTLADLPPRPRGETSIEVTFLLDANGILQVRARDAHTGREQHASLDIVGAMPQEDVAASRERLSALRR
ncbi:MAG: Hsp70 family protein [Acidobacteriota bacterium]